MNTAHEGMDEMIDHLESHPCIKRRGVHRAEPLSADWPTQRQWVAPQGRVEQGWPARRCSSEPSTLVPDRMREEYDPEDQCESADRDVVLWLLKGLVVVLGAMFCAWVIAGWPA